MLEELARKFALNGRSAVVTGAGSGIGRACAIVLAQAGARVIAADIHEDGLAETAGLVEQAGGKALTRHTDVAQRAEIDGLAAEAQRALGRIDIWVNCAGIMVKAPLLDTTEELFDRGVGVNLKGVYFGCIAAGKAMKETGGGSIINISSGGGDNAVPGMSIYCLTKAAVNMVTRNVAKELGPFGIRANTIAPGWIDTPMVSHGFRDASGDIDPELRDEVIRQRREGSPLGLTGEPEDIALTALYLASDAARFTTGQILRPNGGISMV